MFRRLVSSVVCCGFLAGAALAHASGSEAAPQRAPNTPDCPIEPSDFCRLPGAIGLETARERLAETDMAFWREGSVLHIVARRQREPVRLCCSLQDTLDDLGDGLHWGASYRMARLNEAFLDIVIPPDDPDALLEDIPIYRGSGAPERPARAGILAGQIIDVELTSEALGAPRRITAYRPPGPPPAEGWPVVYAGDGDWMVEMAPIAEALAVSGQTAGVVLVGIHNGNSGNGVADWPDMRSREYLWGRDAERFSAHEAFVLGTVMPWAETELGASANPDDRMLFGLSSSAAWAVSTALRNPGLAGHVSAASFGWPGAMRAGEPDASTRYSISAGDFEPSFASASGRLQQWLADAGAEADLAIYASGHSLLSFEQQFARGLLAAFPAEDGGAPPPDGGS